MVFMRELDKPSVPPDVAERRRQRRAQYDATLQSAPVLSDTDKAALGVFTAAEEEGQTSADGEQISQTSAGRHIKKTAEGWLLQKTVIKGKGKLQKKLETWEPLVEGQEIFNNESPHNKRLGLDGWWSFNSKEQDFEKIDAPSRVGAAGRVLTPAPKLSPRIPAQAPPAAPAPRSSPVAAPAAAPKAKPDASPAAPAAAPKAPDPIVIPAMPAAAVIPPAPGGNISTMTGDQLAAFNAQMEARSSAMQRRVVELEGLLKQASDSQIAGKAAQEYLNMKHPMVSATLAATMEHFGPKAGQSAEEIEANMKVFRAIEKRRFALFASGERVTTSEGVKTIGDAIKNYQSQPWYVRWGLGGAMMHGFAASGATALASSYGLLGAVGLLGAIAPPTLAAIGMGAAARELVFRWFKRRKESGGDRGILIKSPHVTGAVIASLFGYGASLAMTPGSIDTIGNFLTKISKGAGSTLRDLLSMSFFGKKMLGAPIPA